MASSKSRESWSGRFGFILAAAGSAIGLGNLWKFPYITWQNGGGSFILVYLACILLVGLPIMIAEIGIGKLSQKNPVGAFRALDKAKSPFAIVGFIGVLIAFLILSYYSVVAGWSIEYSLASMEKKFQAVPEAVLEDYLKEPQKVQKLKEEAFKESIANPLPDNSKKEILSGLGIKVPADGALLNDLYTEQSTARIIQGLTESGNLAKFTEPAYNKKQKEAGFKDWASSKLLADYSTQLFENFLGNPARTIPWHTFFMLLVILIVFSGIKKGIEKAVKLFMPILFVMLLLLVVNSLRLDKEQEGINFILFGNGTKLTGVAFLEALGHAFFTLSLGLGALMTYGSYLNKNANIVSNSLWIVFLDTFIAILACMLIYPIIFVYNLEPTSGGIGILFTTIPLELFKFPNGAFLSLVFYLMIFLAALTSAISLLEVVVSYMVDELRFSRRKAVLYSAGLIYLLGIPSAISPGGFLTPLDNFVTRVLLPVSGFAIAIFAGYKLDQKLMKKEFSNHRYATYWFKAYKFSIRYITPFLVLMVMLGSFL